MGAASSMHTIRALDAEKHTHIPCNRKGFRDRMTPNTSDVLTLCRMPGSTNRISSRYRPFATTNSWARGPLKLPNAATLIIVERCSVKP